MLKNNIQYRIVDQPNIEKNQHKYLLQKIFTLVNEYPAVKIEDISKFDSYEEAYKYLFEYVRKQNDEK